VPSADPAALFQAVSDPTRLRLLRLVVREELNVQELVRILAMNQPRVSKHLATLRDSGWISQRKEGTRSWYRAVAPSEFDGGRALCEQVQGAADGVRQRRRDDAALAEIRAERDARARDFFAGVAADWDRIRSEYEHPDIQLGAIAALVNRRLCVVDIGTGTGALLPWLSGAVGSVVAVDNSPAMLSRAQELCRREELDNVTLQRADIEALPLTDASFDAAYCSMALHHVARPEVAIAEMARVIKPGGRAIVIAFTRHDLVWLREELAHQWLGFTRDDITHLFAEAGLRPLRYLQRRRAPLETVPERSARAREQVDWPDVFLAVAEKPGG
jgi:ArsR family transcriptional regulator